MALKEGKCPNCGSILQLDDKNVQGHCLFCDAVFASEAAYEIAANPTAVSFPNLPQPKYEGPNLNPQLTAAQVSARATQLEMSKKKEAKAAAKAEQPVYTPRADVKIPELKLSHKTKIQLILVAVAIVAIIGVAAMPSILTRNSARTTLIAAVGSYIPGTIDVDKAVVIYGMSNQRLEVALPVAITADEAKAIFLAYGEQRAKAKESTVADFTQAYGDITVKIVFPTGGFLIEQPTTQASLDDGTAIQTLT
ncbi:MAG: hypothetical protein PHC86_04605 [Eubacteriales bacterium]|nr:hypothetical protein [Eubacteriales bacterium]